MNEVTVRRASAADHARLVEFNRAMAWETERIELIPEIISAGVSALLDHPMHGFYLVAECDGQIVGALMVTTEWSDWRNGMFWWVQSVYVVPTHRRLGVYRRMYDSVRQLANDEPNVCGFRLYVEKENATAQTTYKSLGMRQTSYCLFEEVAEGTTFTL